MKVFMLLLFVILPACTVFEAGDIRPERQRLYEYNNNEAFCKQNPDKCINGIPWS